MIIGLKKISIIEELIAKPRLWQYEQILSKKLAQNIKIDINPGNFGLPPWYTSVRGTINSDKYLLPKLIQEDLAYCNSGIDLRTKTMKVAYMETLWGNRKNSWQNYVQAVLCDVFNLEKVIFEQVLSAGQKYIKNSELYKQEEVVDRGNHFDIICSVNKIYLEKLFLE